MTEAIHHIWCKVVASLSMSFFMGWEMLWALVLGFALSSLVQSFVTKSQMNKWFADHSFKSMATAAAFGAASSSCSYAAAAITRSLIQQGADFTAAMAFQFASTNLVLELGILLALLLGWQFTLAQIIGGIFMITFMSLFFQFFLPKTLTVSAIDHAKKIALTGTSQHSSAQEHLHIDKDTASRNEFINGAISFVQGLFSEPGKTAVSRYFFMDWQSLWSDILLGVLIAGALSAWIPDSFWTTLFCKDNSALAHLVDPLIGPVIAILSFVCSIGNVPMAAVLWHQGMTFGGVLSFLFADLLVFPLLNIYRKYYGIKMASFLAVSFYICMVAAAYSCEWLFTLLGLVPNSDKSIFNTVMLPAANTAAMPPTQHMMHHAGMSFNYTAVLNIIALIFTALLFKHFYQSGGFKMLSASGTNKHSCH